MILERIVFVYAIVCEIIKITRIKSYYSSSYPVFWYAVLFIILNDYSIPIRILLGFIAFLNIIYVQYIGELKYVFTNCRNIEKSNFELQLKEILAKSNIDEQYVEISEEFKYEIIFKNVNSNKRRLVLDEINDYLKTNGESSWRDYVFIVLLLIIGVREYLINLI